MKQDSKNKHSFVEAYKAYIDIVFKRPIQNSLNNNGKKYLVEMIQSTKSFYKSK